MATKQKQAEFTKWMGPTLAALRTLGGSGTPKFHNQVQWARQYLVGEGLLSSSKRANCVLKTLATFP